MIPKLVERLTVILLQSRYGSDSNLKNFQAFNIMIFN